VYQGVRRGTRAGRRRLLAAYFLDPRTCVLIAVAQDLRAHDIRARKIRHGHLGRELGERASSLHPAVFVERTHVHSAGGSHRARQGHGARKCTRRVGGFVPQIGCRARLCANHLNGRRHHSKRDTLLCISLRGFAKNDDEVLREEVASGSVCGYWSPRRVFAAHWSSG
jgi:hypothetical protein